MASPVELAAPVFGSGATNVQFQRYADLLRQLRVSGRSDDVVHKYPWESKRIISELIESAIDEEIRRHHKGAPVCIRLLTGTLPWAVYGPPIADQLAKFVASGGQLQILIWGDSVGASSRLLDHFMRSASQGGSCQVRFSQTEANSDKISHLIVAGTMGYRIEAPHGKLDPATMTDLFPVVPARACFNAPKTVKEAAAYFDELWAMCEAPVAAMSR